MSRKEKRGSSSALKICLEAEKKRVERKEKKKARNTVVQGTGFKPKTKPNDGVIQLVDVLADVQWNSGGTSDLRCGALKILVVKNELHIDKS